MAKANFKKNKEDPGVNYKAAVTELKAQGPARLYLLWGKEDYLREQFLTQLKTVCLPGGEDDFSYRRFDGAALDLQALADAIDAIPFLSERSLIEVRDYDTNKAPEAEAARLASLAEDIPDYCTVVFVMGPDFSPDGRLKLTKAMKKHGQVMQFAPQGDSALIGWVSRRFAAWQKRVTVEDAKYLISITGGLMNRMIPEIEKISAYAANDVVTREDIDAVTQKTPDAVVFEVTDCLAEGNRNGAMEKLSELLTDKDASPIMILAVVGQQMRRLYAAKLAHANRLGTQETMELCNLRYDFLLQKLQRSARKFSLAGLERIVTACAEADYAMKHSGADDLALLEDLMLSIMLEAKA